MGASRFFWFLLKISKFLLVVCARKVCAFRNKITVFKRVQMSVIDTLGERYEKLHCEEVTRERMVKDILMHYVAVSEQEIVENTLARIALVRVDKLHRDITESLKIYWERRGLKCTVTRCTLSPSLDDEHLLLIGNDDYSFQLMIEW